MRVLLDECVPNRLGRHLLGHDVKTVTEMGWSSKKNGELLAAMQTAGFEVLLSVDRNLRHQQNLGGKGISIIVLIGVSNRIADPARDNHRYWSVIRRSGELLGISWQAACRKHHGQLPR